MSKKAAAIGVLTSLGIITGTILLASRAKASSEEPGYGKSIPTKEDILKSRTVGELGVWYGYIAQLYFTGKISGEKYNELYQAYVTRFYQLTGANQ